MNVCETCGGEIPDDETSPHLDVKNRAATKAAAKEGMNAADERDTKLILLDAWAFTYEDEGGGDRTTERNRSTHVLVEFTGGTREHLFAD